MNDTLTNTVSTDLFEQHKKRINKRKSVSSNESEILKESIKNLLEKNNASLIAHYYVDLLAWRLFFTTSRFFDR